MNLVLTLREDRQRRRLDPTNWGELETAGRASIECRHGAGPVDTNQPVAFRSADCRLAERDHLFI